MLLLRFVCLLALDSTISKATGTQSEIPFHPARNSNSRPAGHGGSHCTELPSWFSPPHRSDFLSPSECSGSRGEFDRSCRGSGQTDSSGRHEVQSGPSQTEATVAIVILRDGVNSSSLFHQTFFSSTVSKSWRSPRQAHTSPQSLGDSAGKLRPGKLGVTVISRHHVHIPGKDVSHVWEIRRRRGHLLTS